MRRADRGPTGSTLALAATVLVLVTGCMVGPNYVRPPVITPDGYKEVAGWKVARPQDAAARGPWWDVFGDPQLSALEAQVDVSNQNLAVAEAQFRQARALVREARAAYFPTATLGIGVTRSLSSSTIGLLSGGNVSSAPRTDFTLPLAVSWEPDFWGRIRRSVESSQASAQASAADLETIRLSFQAELAQDYFELQTLDAQRQLLDASVDAFA